MALELNARRNSSTSSKPNCPIGGQVFRCLIMEVGSAAQIDRNSNESFIHWQEGPAVTSDPGFITERLSETFAENDAGIFDAVMIVHLQISADIDLEIEQAVLAEESEHMIEERDAGLDGGSAGAIDHEVDRDISFRRLSLQVRRADFQSLDKKDSTKAFGAPKRESSDKQKNASNHLHRCRNASKYLHAISTPSLERKRPSGFFRRSNSRTTPGCCRRTFSRDGLRGATTREIAREAGVNEVTLFRHFKSKEQLLRAVLQRGLASEVAIMDEHSSWKENLRESMEKYARHYYSHVEKKKGMARAFLAEAQTLPKSMQTMIADVIRPVRERLVLILADAQRAGVVRNDLNVECALDAFKNTLYAGMLRQGAYLPRNYTTDTYISTVVDIFVRGIETAAN